MKSYIALFALSLTVGAATAALFYCATQEPDYCALADRSAAESISFYQDPSEAKNRDEITKKLALLCRQQRAGKTFDGTKRVVLQNKAGAFVS